jgi:hypothetical protein
MAGFRCLDGVHRQPTSFGGGAGESFHVQFHAPVIGSGAGFENVFRHRPAAAPCNRVKKSQW